MKLSRNTLKGIGVFITLLFSISCIFIGPYTTLGRICTGLTSFSLFSMCYLVAEGYFYSRNWRLYFVRLCIFGSFAELPYILAFRFTLRVCLNVLYAYAVCLIICYLITEVKNPWIRILGIGIIVWKQSYFDDGLALFLFTFLLVWFRNKGKNAIRIAFAGGFLFYLTEWLLKGIRSGFAKNQTENIVRMVSIVLAYLICAYAYRTEYKSGGMRGKWVFYIFYPLSYLVLFVLSVIIG